MWNELCSGLSLADQLASCMCCLCLLAVLFLIVIWKFELIWFADDVADRGYRAGHGAPPPPPTLDGCYERQADDLNGKPYYVNDDGYQLHNYRHGQQDRWAIHSEDATADDKGMWSGALASATSSAEEPPENGWGDACKGPGHRIPQDWNTHSPMRVTDPTFGCSSDAGDGVEVSGLGSCASLAPRQAPTGLLIAALLAAALL